MARPRSGRPTAEQQEDRDLNGILKALDSNEGWVVKIWRLMPGGGDSWLANLPLGEVGGNIEALIAERWGPGKYKVRAWSDNKQEWAPQKTVWISPQAAEDSGFEGDAAPIVYSDAPRGGDDRILTIMQQSSDRTMTMMMETNKLIFGMITAMVSNRTGPDAMGMLAQVTETLRNMKEMSGAAADPLDQLKKFAEIRDLLGGNDSDSGDPGTRMLLKAMDTLPQLMTAGARGGNRLPPEGPPIQRVGLADIPEEREPDQGDTLFPKDKERGNPVTVPAAPAHPSVWGRLMFKAMRNSDPWLWAEWTLEAQEFPTPEGEEARDIINTVDAAKDFDTWALAVGSPEVKGSEIPKDGPIREWWSEWFGIIRTAQPEEENKEEVVNNEPI